MMKYMILSLYKILEISPKKSKLRWISFKLFATYGICLFCIIVQSLWCMSLSWIFWFTLSVTFFNLSVLWSIIKKLLIVNMRLICYGTSGWPFYSLLLKIHDKYMMFINTSGIPMSEILSISESWNSLLFNDNLSFY